MPKEGDCRVICINTDGSCDKPNYRWDCTLLKGVQAIEVPSRGRLINMEKAHWIHIPSDGKFKDTCVCSACKRNLPIESWIVQGFNAYPYCFADMREEI